MAAARKRKKLWLWILLVFLGLPCVLFVIYWSTSILGSAPSRLEVELKGAKADGFPLTVEELKDKIKIDPSQNAASDLRQAFAVYKAWAVTDEGKKDGKLVGRAYNASSLNLDQVETVGASLSQLSTYFHVLENATKKSGLDYERDWAKGPALNFPEIGDERSAVSFVLIKARYDLLQGRVKQTLSDLDIGAKLSRLIGKDPSVISYLIQCQAAGQVCSVADMVIRHFPGDLSVLNSCRQCLEELNLRLDLRKPLWAEFLMARIAVKILATGGARAIFGNESDQVLVRIAQFAPARTAYELRLVQVHREVGRAFANNAGSIPRTQDALAKIQASVEKKSKSDWSYGLVESISPIFTGLPTAVGEAEAKRNVLLSAIDVLESKATSGHFPEKRIGTTGHWLDPFMDKPLIYRSSPGGFIVYSLGPDKKDDSGRPRSRKYSDYSYDISFEYP